MARARRIAIIDNDERPPLDELRRAIGPLRCGGPRRLGKFYGIHWPKHFERLAAEARERAPLSRPCEEELSEAVRRLKADFIRADAEAPAELSNMIARMLADAAFVMSFGTPDSLQKLRSAVGRQNKLAGGSPATNSAMQAFRDLGEASSIKSVQDYARKRGAAVPSKSTISRARKKFP